jgi:hypothetical protein
MSFGVLVDLVLGYEKATARKKWVDTITALLGAHKTSSA